MDSVTEGPFLWRRDDKNQSKRFMLLCSYRGKKNSGKKKIDLNNTKPSRDSVPLRGEKREEFGAMNLSLSVCLVTFNNTEE